jgi:hypothetical protein
MKEVFWFIFSVCVAMVGYTIHHSIFWSIVDFFFAPLAIVKWLICHELTFEIIRQTFSFLGN